MVVLSKHEAKKLEEIRARVKALAAVLMVDNKGALEQRGDKFALEVLTDPASYPEIGSDLASILAHAGPDARFLLVLVDMMAEWVENPAYLLAGARNLDPARMARISREIERVPESHAETTTIGLKASDLRYLLGMADLPPPQFIIKVDDGPEQTEALREQIDQMLQTSDFTKIAILEGASRVDVLPPIPMPEKPAFDFDMSAELSIDTLREELLALLKNPVSRCLFDIRGPGGGNTNILIFTRDEQDKGRIEEYIRKHDLAP